MQNSKHYFIILIICLAFTNCQWLKKQATPPNEVVLKFVRALEKLDLDLAVTYCDSATAIIFEQFKSVSQSMSQEMRDKTITQMKLIQQANCQVESNTARCTICCNENGDNIPETINLRLIKGEWLIALNPNADAESTPATPPVEDIAPPTEDFSPAVEETPQSVEED